MTKPKVTYFDFPGSRGEEVRLALWLAGVEFEDNRLDGAKWPELKPKTPFGSLPTLEIPGKPTLAQSNAILVLIGRQHGLHPTDNFEAARHEALLSVAEELRGVVVPVLKIKDPEQSIAARKELGSGYLRTWGANVERQLGDGPFLAGDAINVTDIKLHMISKWFSSGAVDHVPKDVFGDCPKLLGIEKAVREHPKVVDWYAR